MLALGGFAFLMICVFGTYAVDGGSMPALLEALPFEMLTIGGAAIGTFVMANSMHDVKHTLSGMTKVLTGSAYKRDDYVDLLSLLFLLVRLASTKGNMALEPHIENPKDSAAFQKFPKILSNHHASAII
ncbi:MAG: motility-associated protein, partial [Rhizomicrobium sp.]